MICCTDRNLTDKLKAGDEYITAYKFDEIAQQANVEKDNLR